MHRSFGTFFVSWYFGSCNQELNTVDDGGARDVYEIFAYSNGIDGKSDTGWLLLPLQIQIFASSNIFSISFHPSVFVWHVRFF
jgi:hypothetical protein